MLIFSSPRPGPSRPGPAPRRGADGGSYERRRALGAQPYGRPLCQRAYSAGCVIPTSCPSALHVEEHAASTFHAGYPTRTPSSSRPPRRSRRASRPPASAGSPSGTAPGRTRRLGRPCFRSSWSVFEPRRRTVRPSELCRGSCPCASRAAATSRQEHPARRSSTMRATAFYSALGGPTRRRARVLCPGRHSRRGSRPLPCGQRLPSRGEGQRRGSSRFDALVERVVTELTT